jgi:outer membrane immunogenic protein
MRISLILAAFAACVSTPALANEGHVEAHGGIAWAAGASEAFAGVGAGYDFDLGDKGFIGVEGTADKILAKGSTVLWSLGARGGLKTSDAGKLYANAGIGFNSGNSDVYAGAGYQHKFGSSFYGKVEYRHIFTGGGGINFAGLGLGYAF